jgi:hypothetical protein
VGFSPKQRVFECAIQDQVLNTKNYRKLIVKDGTVGDSCRQCDSAVENIQHIIYLDARRLDYKDRHDSVATICLEKLTLQYPLPS